LSEGGNGGKNIPHKGRRIWVEESFLCYQECLGVTEEGGRLQRRKKRKKTKGKKVSPMRNETDEKISN